MRIAPEYPPEALAGGLEGEVILRFTILPNGTTADVEVVQSTSPIFEEAAVTAVVRWRYQPRTEALRGVNTVIRFALQPDVARHVPPADRGPAA